MTDLVHLARLSIGAAKRREPREGDTLARFLIADTALRPLPFHGAAVPTR
jgi:hypothetical protein